MLASEFNPEMGSLIRSLEKRVLNNPTLRHQDLVNALDHIEEAIVILVALHIKMRQVEDE